MRNYIAKHFKPRVLETFLKINNDYMAARVDLFRYCVMYNEGGIYLDIKSVLVDDIMSYVHPDDTAILDRQRTDYEGYRAEMNMGTHEQWLLVYAPRHDYMRRAINRICDAVAESCRNKKSFTESVWSEEMRGSSTTPSKEVVLRLTGPDGLANAIQASILAHGPQHRTIPYETFARISITENGVSSRESMVGDGKHYSEHVTPVIVCDADITSAGITDVYQKI
jgi:hypothetical protein